MLKPCIACFKEPRRSTWQTKCADCLAANRPAMPPDQRPCTLCDGYPRMKKQRCCHSCHATNSRRFWQEHPEKARESRKQARKRSAKGNRAKHYIGIRNGKIEPKKNELIMLAVEQTVPEYDECMHWPGVKNELGYGQVSWKGKVTLAHRLALELKLGRPIQKGLRAVRTCKSRDCYNPNHVYEGTHLESLSNKK